MVEERLCLGLTQQQVRTPKANEVDRGVRENEKDDGLSRLHIRPVPKTVLLRKSIAATSPVVDATISRYLSSRAEHGHPTFEF